MRKDLQRILFILGPQAKRLPFITILFLATSFLDLISIGLVAPLLISINDPHYLLSKLQSSPFQSLATFPMFRDESLMIGFFAVLVGLTYMIRTVYSVYIQKKVVNFASETQTLIMTKYIDDYLNQSYEEIKTTDSSKLLLSVTSHVQTFVSKALLASIRLFSEVVLVSIVFIFLLWTQFRSTIILGLFMCVVLILFNAVLKRRIQQSGSQFSKSYYSIIRTIQECVMGYREIRVLGKMDYYKKTLNHAVEDLERNGTRYNFFLAIPRYFIECAFVLGFVVVILDSTFFRPQNLTGMLASIGIMFASGIRLLPSISQILNCLSQMQFAKDAVNALYEKGTRASPAEPSQKKRHADELNSFQDVSFSRVSFRYHNNPSPVLKQVDFSVKKGEMIGLVGRSGSGKSTLIDLLIGLLSPTEGSVQVNGSNLRDSVETWMHKLAYIPQEILLIDDSIRNNIALGVVQTEQDENLLLEAIRVANLSDVVAGMKEGMEARIGERGSRLSGGQRQRVAIARAYYHQREILVLDEATSALDADSEREIMEAIVQLKGRITVIVIAHKTEILRSCDRIFMLEDGQIRSVDMAAYFSRKITPKFVADADLHLA